MPNNMKLFEVRVRVWDDYIVEVDAEDEFEAVQFVQDNINEVEHIGYNSDGGRDVDDVILLGGREEE